MDKPVFEPTAAMRMVGRTANLEEANRIAGDYEARGFDTQIVKKKQAGIAYYEVWAGKKPDVFVAAPGL